MDTYTQFTNSALGKRVARTLGLPQPSPLRRYTPTEPLIDGVVVVLGDTAGSDALAEQLLGFDLDVRRHPGPKESIGAVIAVLDEVTSPAQISEVMLQLSSLLRQLRPSGRVITVFRAPEEATDIATRATRQSLVGITRSLGKEMRTGSTANAVVLAHAVPTGSTATAGALRFLLSGRSAFVSGQLLHLTEAAGAFPADWSQPLEAQVAVVTGAARGIGAEIARTLHRDGAQIIAVDIPAAGEQLAALANEVSGTALQLDVTSQTAAEKILAHAQQHYSRLDIMVHNAGITRDKLLANMTEDRWESVLAVNLESQLRINETLLASELFGTGEPRIISLASTSGIAGNRGQTNYAASKAGVIGMVAASAATMRELSGTINAVAPGFIRTEMTEKMPPVTREVASRSNSLAQAGEPGDVAEVVAYLASTAAGGINGEVLRVCGQNLIGA